MSTHSIVARCRMCNRPLKGESATRGIGPECWVKVRGILAAGGRLPARVVRYFAPREVLDRAARLVETLPGAGRLEALDALLATDADYRAHREAFGLPLLDRCACVADCSRCHGAGVTIAAEELEGGRVEWLERCDAIAELAAAGAPEDLDLVEGW